MRLLLQVSHNLDSPLRLNAIRIVGTQHTRSSFLGRVASPHLYPSSAPSSSFFSKASSIDSETRTTSTLRDVLRKTRDLTDTLEKFDIFSEVEAGLESSRGILADEQDVDLVVKVKEASRYFVRTATDVGDGEGNAVSAALFAEAFKMLG